MVTRVEVVLADEGTLPLAATYEDDSSPAEYDSQFHECTLHRSMEWKMMVKLGLEIEYTTQVITHEQIHEIVERQHWRYHLRHYKKKAWRLKRQVKLERLIHKGDICALLGF